MASAKEAMDLKNEQLTREIEQKTRMIQELLDETTFARETIAKWEGKATAALRELERTNRDLSEATENATSLKVQIASANARAEHAEESLKSQTTLLDEMAELQAEKEAARAAVVTLEQESEAKSNEIAILAKEAKVAAEAAVKWEGKAVAAQKQLEKRAKVAEEAAAAVKAVADDRLRALELGEASGTSQADEAAVAAAVKLQAEAIEAAAEFKVYAATRDTESLRRALAASDQALELWRAKAEATRAELEETLEEREYDARNNGSRGGRLASYGFSQGADLRSFIVRGSPRVVPVTAAEEDALNGSANALTELESVGLGAPFHGRYDLIDPPKHGKKEKSARAWARSGAAPVPKWDPNEEAANKERLPFNPRARGVVGKKTEAAAE